MASASASGREASGRRSVGGRPHRRGGTGVEEGAAARQERRRDLRKNEPTVSAGKREDALLYIGNSSQTVFNRSRL